MTLWGAVMFGLLPEAVRGARVIKLHMARLSPCRSAVTLSDPLNVRPEQGRNVCGRH